MTEEAVGRVAKTISSMSKVQAEQKGSATQRNGTARVTLDLSNPLQLETIREVAEEFFWVDFEYERLLYFYDACGKIGHCSKFNQEVTFDKNILEECLYGYWLKAKEYSQFWKLFYGKLEEDDMEVEFYS